MHKGFQEEKEWRIVYLPERDSKSQITPMIGYAHGINGVEPKLKLEIEPMPNVIGAGVELEEIVHSIILGPSTPGRLSLRSVQKMLQILKKFAISEKVYQSSIPYRPAKTA